MGVSTDFFRDEVRNGFYIPAAIKQAWAATLEVLGEIDKICTKYNITYFADWGTLLGAVRHGGFVPWDDDLDIGMKRDDYERFRSVADAELPENYVIHDYERKDDHWEFLIRVVNNSKICFDEKYLREHNNFPWLAGVDIFIKDYLYPSADEEEERDKEVMKLYAVAQMVIEEKYNRAALIGELNEINRRYGSSFSIDEPHYALAVSLYRLAEQQMARVPKEKSNRIGQIFPWIIKRGSDAGEDMALYEKFIRLPFENTTIPVPVSYNKVLKKRYGNYYEIKKVWTGHDYPFFEGQKKDMERIMGSSFPGFYFTKEMTDDVEKDLTGSIKNTAWECVSVIKNLLISAEDELNGGFFENASRNLTEAQQLAIDLGTLLEKQKGEDNPRTKSVVSALEELCECIWRDDQKLAEKAQNNLELSMEAFSKVENAVRKNIEDVKEVLFLPIGPEEWEGLRSVYESVREDADVDISIVPLPLLKKDYIGNVYMSNEEINKASKRDSYDKELKLTDWKNYDISVHCPDVVYMQNPYDETNPCLTVPPAFYTRAIRRYAGEIIYIPFKETDEFGDDDRNDIYSMKHYVAAPGVIYADKVMVQSENIRKRYIQCLDDFSGGQYREYWERKVVAESKKIPSENDKVKEKKRVIFGIGANELAEHSEIIVRAIEQRINIFVENSERIDVSVYFYPNDTEKWRVVGSEHFDEIIALVKKAGINVVSAKPKESERLSRDYDAYYGSPTPLVPAFFLQKKPVMIADFDI